MNRQTNAAWATTLTLTLCAAPAVAQSSSLYVNTDEPVAAPFRGAGGQVDRSSPSMIATSYMAVRIPEPREFQMHDLVEIIIRESVEARSGASLDTDRSANFRSEIKALPPVSLPELLEFQIKGSSTLSNPPKVDISHRNSFSGDGDYGRRDSFTGRIQARIIDIKPNGTIVLEARKRVQNDKEVLEMVLTGTARPDDITAQNTVLSTQLYDMHLTKKHDGELNRATKKGPLTKLLEFIIPF